MAVLCSPGESRGLNPRSSVQTRVTVTVGTVWTSSGTKYSIRASGHACDQSTEIRHRFNARQRARVLLSARADARFGGVFETFVAEAHVEKACARVCARTE